MRFTPYIDDNGTNSVALPFCVASRHMKLPLHGSSEDYPTLTSLAMPNESISFNVMSMARTLDADGNAPYNASEPHANDNRFTYTYTNNGDGGNSCTPYGFDTSIRRMHIRTQVHPHDPNYMGPFRSDANGNFQSGEDDCKPMYLDIKVDVDSPVRVTLHHCRHH